jgi:hypothetical protein
VDRPSLNDQPFSVERRSLHSAPRAPVETAGIGIRDRPNATGENAQWRRSVLAPFSALRRQRQATGLWHIACGNCGNHKILAAAAGPCRVSRLGSRLRKLRKVPPWPACPVPPQNRGQGGKVENLPISCIGPNVFLGAITGTEMGRIIVRIESSLAVRGPTGIGGREASGARLLRHAVAKPREPSENSQSFQCGKASYPRQWCLLIPTSCVPKFCPKVRSRCGGREVRD